MWLRQEPDNNKIEPFLCYRILARIFQKSRQLHRYREPVILALTVPHQDPSDEEVDVKQLAGSITLLLQAIPHISMVLLSLWDIEPSFSRSGIRLSNAYVVERSAQQCRYPRVRLLIANPAAMFPLPPREVDLLKAFL
jgi:hypothetical protein